MAKFESKHFLSECLSALMTVRLAILNLPSEILQNPDGLVYGLSSLLKFVENDLRTAMGKIDKEVFDCFVEKDFNKNLDCEGA